MSNDEKTHPYVNIMKYAALYLKANKVKVREIASQCHLESKVVSEFLKNNKRLLNMFKEYKFLKSEEKDRFQEKMASLYNLKLDKIKTLEEKLDNYISKT
jgi:nitrate/TMAO reductase-like tetraheme cytochrome c subunit